MGSRGRQTSATPSCVRSGRRSAVRPTTSALRSRIELVGDVRRARFRIEKSDKLRLIADYITPAVLLDTLFRLSMIHVAPSGDIPI